MKVVRVPMLDTGLGLEAGYASDAEMVAAYEAMLLDLEPWQRDLLRKLSEEETRRFVMGEGS